MMAEVRADNSTGKVTALSREQRLGLLRQMLLIRRFEEKAAELYTLGKIHGFLHLYIGEEAVGVGVMQALAADDDIVSTYREHGHAIARGMSPSAVMAEMYGKANGCSRGRGGSMHLFDVGRRFFGGNAIVAGGLPVAVGLALANKLRGHTNVTACFFGDGAVDEGEFHESLNLAALWKLPVLFVCENNLYAMGTGLARHSRRPISMRRPGPTGWAAKPWTAWTSWRSKWRRSRRSTQSDPARDRFCWKRARTASVRIQCTTPSCTVRKPKSRSGSSAARSKSIPDDCEQSGLLTDADWQELEAGVAGQVAEAVAYAEAGPWEPVEDLLKDVYTPRQEAAPSGASESRGSVEPAADGRQRRKGASP